MNNPKPFFLPQRLFIGGATFASINALLLPSTWQFGSNWEPFPEHLHDLIDAISGQFINNPAPWNEYKFFLTESQQWTDFILHIGLPLTAATVGAIVTQWLVLREPTGLQQKQIEGSMHLDGLSAKRHAKKQLKKNLSKGLKKSLYLHKNIQIPIDREIDNLFISGIQGSGKSVIIKPYIKQIIAREDRILIYDQKQEYTELFFDQNKSILLNPTDSRSTPWDIASDVTTDELAELIAISWIQESREAFWSQGARLILIGIFVILNHLRRKSHWGWADLTKYLTLQSSELKKLLEVHYPRAAIYIEENSKTTQGFMTTLTSSLSWVFSVAKAWPDSKDGFSIKRWVHEDNQKTTVIIPNDSLYRAISGPLCNALISLMTSHVLALPDDNSRRLWLALDELGNLPRSESLTSWLSLGRSKGARTIAGTQAISILYDPELYGEHKATTILSMFGTRICLRTVDEAAIRASNFFGKQYVERPSSSVDELSRQGTNYQIFEVPLISPNQISQLPTPNNNGVTGFLSVSGHNAVYELTWKYPKIPCIAPPHVPAEWTKEKQHLKRGRKQ